MAIDWSHLPKDVQNKVCLNWSGNCGRTKDSRGYIHEPATGYFVCVNCSKPAPLVGVQECDICAKPFVPNTHKEVTDRDFLGIICYGCNPPKQTS